MDFELNEEQKILQGMIRSFAWKEIQPLIADYEEKHKYPEKILKKLADLGIFGMAVPPEYGGIKTDHLSLAIVIEELSRVSPSIAVILSVHCSNFCYSILRHGDEGQKRRYLPPAARGEIMGAFSLTEPGAGSDPSGITTKAEKREGGYYLNGTKAWVSNGNNAHVFLLFALRDMENGQKKASAFIVEKGFPGFRVSKIEEKMGLHSSETVELTLENCRVPAENLLGEEGKGISIALQSLDVSRIGIAAQAVGLAQQALEEAVKYAKQRQAFGQKIAEFQAIQFMLADIATQVDAARLLTYRAAVLCDKGLPFSKEASMAKLFASEAANRIAYQALQIHGGYGYSREFPIERIFRDARVLTIYEGTSEIQRLVIARNLLK